jgi:hypothetical protein
MAIKNKSAKAIFTPLLSLLFLGYAALSALRRS